MEDNKIRLSIPEFVYILYFAVMFGAKAIGLYDGQLLYNISIIVGMLLFGIKILVTEHSILEYFIIIFFLAMAFAVYFNTGEKGILFYYTMILGMKGISRKRVERFACFFLSGAFWILTFCYTLILDSDITYMEHRFPFGGVIRRSLGYSHPNTLMTTYIICVILFFSIVQMKQIKQLLCASLFAGFVGGILFVYSASNTGIIVTVFFIIVNFYFQTRKRLSKAEMIAVKSTYLLCLFISIFLPYITFNNVELSMKLDLLSHTRWSLSQYYLFNEKISLFGTRFKEMYKPDGYAYMIDSSFLYLFMQVGIVTFIVVTLLHMGMIKYHVDNEHKVEIASILTLCLLGLSDPFLFNVSYKNIMFIYVGEWMWTIIDVFTKELKWNNSYQIINLDRLSINIPTFKSIKNWTRFFASRCVDLMILYFVTFFTILFSLCSFSWANSVDGILDEISEWEYFRYNIALGHWCGVFLVIVICFFAYRKDYKEIYK